MSKFKSEIDEYNECYDFITKDPRAKDLINENKFEELFEVITNDLSAVYIDVIASFLMFDCGINFMLYMENIPDKMFYQNWLIKNIVIPDNIKSIGDSAFTVYQLETITIPDSVEFIDEYAFNEVEHLITIKCHEGSYVDKYAQENNIKVEYI